MTSLSNKNLLMIAYLFPPIGGSGALRPLKLAKYLHAYKWHPVVLTVKNPDWYYAYDYELLEELNERIPIQRSPMVQSTWLYRMVNPFKINKLDSIIKQYFFHPDEQIGWFPLALTSAFKIVRRYNIHAVYSTSGPMTNHLVAYFIKKKTGLPWVAEFRDEWLENPALNMPTACHRRFHFLVEKMVVRQANLIVTMAPVFSRFLSKHDSSMDKFLTIPAGYDPDDFNQLHQYNNSTTERDRFNIVFTGLYYETFRPNAFLNGINELISSGRIPKEKIRVQFIGGNTKGDLNVTDHYHICEYTGFVPRKKAISYLAGADLLLLLLSRERGKGVIPSKTFEYMASKKPILALVPSEVEVADMIKKTNSGIVVDCEDLEGMKRVCLDLYQNWERNGKLDATTDMSTVGQYNLKILVHQLNEMLHQVIG